MSWNILLVEDEVDAQEIFHAMLSMSGLDVDVVGNGAAALEALETKRYHAAIIDLMLPDVDGLQLIRYVRTAERTANLPCIAITAYNSGGLRREAVEAGFNLYFAKPLDQQEITVALRRLII
jgi:two-component system, sensor histidine kinase